jgi:putative tryptophan/tyrosine transport system substrate-binding protein
MKRREFIAGLGGAAVWPLAARAQQLGIPVVGYLFSGSPKGRDRLAAAFRKGLGEMGYVEDRNVVIEYRYAEDQYDRLPVLAAELVRHRAAVICTGGSNAALAAKAAQPITGSTFTPARSSPFALSSASRRSSLRSR